jgi:hypothetical protein
VEVVPDMPHKTEERQMLQELQELSVEEVRETDQQAAVQEQALPQVVVVVVVVVGNMVRQI